VLRREGMEDRRSTAVLRDGPAAQQVIGTLVCKDVWGDTGGDVVVCEAPTYPGAVPTFWRVTGGRRRSRYAGPADGMAPRGEARGRNSSMDLEGRGGGRPKVIYTVTTFTPRRR